MHLSTSSPVSCCLVFKGKGIKLHNLSALGDILTLGYSDTDSRGKPIPQHEWKSRKRAALSAHWSPFHFPL